MGVPIRSLVNYIRKSDSSIIRLQSLIAQDRFSELPLRSHLGAGTEFRLNIPQCERPDEAMLQQAHQQDIGQAIRISNCSLNAIRAQSVGLPSTRSPDPAILCDFKGISLAFVVAKSVRARISPASEVICAIISEESESNSSNWAEHLFFEDSETKTNLPFRCNGHQCGGV